MSTLFLYFLSILSVSNFLSFSLFLLIVLLFNFFAISNFVSISQMLCSSWNSNWFEDNMSERIDVQDFNDENKWQILMEGSVVANVVTWLVVTSTVLTDTIWELDTINYNNPNNIGKRLDMKFPIFLLRITNCETS